ncbi:hypothetical protein CGI64_11835 [Vibrio parahaemolyticus]|nr:hypothetical protein CGI64_11835 [Vibrio parahaemolyticus]
MHEVSQFAAKSLWKFCICFEFAENDLSKIFGLSNHMKGHKVCVISGFKTQAVCWFPKLGYSRVWSI